MTEAEKINEDLNFKLKFKWMDLLLTQDVLEKSQALNRVINKKAYAFPAFIR